MKTLCIFDYLIGIKARRFLKLRIRPRSYSRRVLDKKKYIGLRMKHLLNLFTDLTIKALNGLQILEISKSNPVYAELKTNNGTMLFVFEKLICVQVEYFSDRKL